MLNTFAGSKGESREGVDRLLGSADAAVLLVERFQYCGIAYGWADRTPVSVTEKDCATGLGGFTVVRPTVQQLLQSCSSFLACFWLQAHELGHNMGANHDRDNAYNRNFPVRSL